jgi:hypothetical protein
LRPLPRARVVPRGPGLLALGIALGVAVYTADQSWKGLRLGIRIHHIR